MANGAIEIYEDPYNFQKGLEKIKEWLNDHFLSIMLVRWSAFEKRLHIVHDDFSFYIPPENHEEVFRLLTEERLKEACNHPESAFAWTICGGEEAAPQLKQIVVNPITAKQFVMGADIPDGQHFQIAVATKPEAVSAHGLPDLPITNKELGALREIAEVYSCLSLTPPDEAQETHFAILAVEATKKPQQISDRVQAEILDSVGKRLSTLTAATWTDEAVDKTVEMAIEPYQRAIRTISYVVFLFVVEIAVAAAYIIWSILQ